MRKWAYHAVAECSSGGLISLWLSVGESAVAKPFCGVLGFATAFPAAAVLGKAVGRESRSGCHP
jgi:hypothetical protein